MNQNKLISIIAFIALFLLVFLFVSSNNSKVEYKSTNESTIYVSTDDLKENLSDFYEVEPRIISIHITPKQKITAKKMSDINTLMQYFTGERSFADLDRAMVAFLKDNTIPRKDKINGLWSMIETLDISSNKGLYILDYLATLLPIELTDKLIEVYDEQTDIYVQSKMMDVIYSSLDIANPEVQDEEKLNFIISKYKEIESFLYEKTMNTKDGKISMEALAYYTQIVPPEEAFELFQSLQNGELKTKDLNKGKLLSLMTETVLSTSESQETLFPEILNSAKNSTLNEKEKTAFNKTIIEALNNDVLTAQSKEEVKSYIDEIEPSFSSKTNIDTVEDYYFWVNAKANVENIEPNQYLEQLVSNNENSLKISSILLYGDDNLIQNIKENTNNHVVEQLTISLESSTFDEGSKLLMRDALNRLSQG